MSAKQRKALKRQEREKRQFRAAFLVYVNQNDIRDCAARAFRPRDY